MNYLRLLLVLALFSNMNCTANQEKERKNCKEIYNVNMILHAITFTITKNENSQLKEIDMPGIIMMEKIESDNYKRCKHE